MIQGLQQAQQAVILNGNRVSTTAPITVQKQKANNDLIDLTDEEEKTKSELKIIYSIPFFKDIFAK